MESNRNFLYPVPDTNRVIFRKGKFVLLDDNPGTTLWNRELPFKKGHAHLRRGSKKDQIERAKFCVNCIKAKRIPPNTDHEFLETVVRVSNNEKFLEYLEMTQGIKREWYM